MYIWNNNNYKIGVTVLSKNEKRKSLFYLIAVTLIFIIPVSGESFENAGFETGNATGWNTGSFAYGHPGSVDIGLPYNYSSTYGCRLRIDNAVYGGVYINQEVDLTGVTNLSFDYRVTQMYLEYGGNGDIDFFVHNLYQFVHFSPDHVPF